jgi:hypothetical protein
MHIPEHIRIGAITWTVEQVPSIELGDDEKCGDCDHSLARIRLNRDMLDDLKALTFLHELLHAINNEMEHSEVEMVSTLLLQVLTESDLDLKS